MQVEVNEKEFVDTVNELISEHQIQQVIESGTSTGDGSTLVFAKTGLPVSTIECRRQWIDRAVENLKDYPNVSIFHAHSLDKDFLINEMPEHFDYLGEENVRRDHDRRYGNDAEKHVQHYIREVDRGETDYNNILPVLINNSLRQLVFLDSAGGCGYMEFKEFMKLPSMFLQNKVLIMDDVDHLKHFRSFHELYEMGYDPQQSKDTGRFGWCAFK